ncbi:MAG: M56 family metallopeptidase [Tepidiformaceae bacterium]
MLLAIAAVSMPAWLLIGPPSHQGRTPVAGVVDACQEGVRRGSFAAVGLAAAGILLLWGASAVITALLVGGRTGLAALRAAHALARSSREVDVFAGGSPVPVRILPCRSMEAFTAGLLRPRIYVGASVISQLQPAELEAVVLHELAHAQRRDPLRCWLVQTVATSLWWPRMRSLPPSHRAARESEADCFAVECVGDDVPLLRALLSIDPVPVAPGFSPLTTERITKLREMRQPPGGTKLPAFALFSGAALFALLLLAASLGLSDWQAYWLCPDGTTMSA